VTDFRVLRADDARDRLRWLEIWHSSPDREIFAHPAYVELFAKHRDRALCAAQTGNGGVLYPFIHRKLRDLPWARDESASDVTSAYGYSGAFAWGEPDGPAFWRELEGWLADEKVVSSFTRLSLFPDQQLQPPSDPEVLFPNVVRSLDLDPEALWKNYAHKVRKNVNKARRGNLRVERDTSGQHLAEFLEIYASTMDRRDARAEYYFSETFFRHIVEQLNGSFVFFHVFDGERIVSTELVLVSTRYLYSFLGGTREDAFDKRPNDLLKHEVIEWGHREGKVAFVLGGGYSGEDGIYKYKQSFAPNGSVPFRVLKRVHRPDDAERLVALRRAQAEAAQTSWDPRPGFFPPYRS
jgi:hypothetical protein